MSRASGSDVAIVATSPTIALASAATSSAAA
jgi:hypothetical protein